MNISRIITSLLIIMSLISPSSLLLITAQQSIPSTTVLGGSKVDYGAGLDTDSDGNIVLTGSTNSKNYVTTQDSRKFGGYFDAFLTKLSPTGEIIFSTYLGGRDYDEGYAVAVDSEDNIVVTGKTRSVDFPVTQGSFDPYYGGKSTEDEEIEDSIWYDSFVAKFSSEGDLLWSTFLGGSHWDEARGLTIDSKDNIIITGEGGQGSSSQPGEFPVINPDNDTNVTGLPSFVTKFDPSGEVVFSQVFNIIGPTLAYGGVEVDNNDDIYVAGDTRTGFRTENWDIFLMKINSTGSKLWNMTYGGTGDDHALDLAVNNDRIYIAGWTTSSDIIDTSAIGGGDNILLSVDNQGALEWGSLWGGTKFDRITSLGTTNSSIFTIGETRSSDYLEANGCNLRGEQAMVLNEINIADQTLKNTIAIGPTYKESAFNLLLDDQNEILLKGATFSNQIYGEQTMGQADIFLIRGSTQQFAANQTCTGVQMSVDILGIIVIFLFFMGMAIMLYQDLRVNTEE